MMSRKQLELLAREEAKKSRCHERKVGCIIVDGEDTIIGRGHNKSETCLCEDFSTPISYNSIACQKDVIHAEAMAIEDAFYAEQPVVTHGGLGLKPPYTLVVTHPPCNNCLRIIEEAPVDMKVIVCEQFMKFDDEKDPYQLLPPEWEQALVKVLAYGAKKYQPNNWQNGSVDRYYAALRRHLNAWRCGEKKDPETGMPHLWHIFTNVGFLITLTEGTDNE